MAVRRPARTDSRVDLVLAVVCGVTAFILLALPTPARSGVAARFRGTIVAPLVSMQEKAELTRRAYLAHDATLHAADSVAFRSQLLNGVEEENGRLRRLLGLASALKWGFVPAEALQGRGLGDDFTITLSAGKSSGVESQYPVVTTDGLVGMVERADNSQSLAIFWPHPDFRVSAMAADGSAFGIVTGHRGEGALRYFLELHSVPLRSPLKAGTLIVSSGLGGVFPRGIPVGIVVSELKTGEGFAKSYLMRPMVNLPDIASVFVLKPERVRAGVVGVWTTPAADSARKALVAAGDSMRAAARRDSTLKAAAKRDTTKRDSTLKAPGARDTVPRARAKRDTTLKPRAKRDTIPKAPAKRDTIP